MSQRGKKRKAADAELNPNANHNSKVLRTSQRIQNKTAPPASPASDCSTDSDSDASSELSPEQGRGVCVDIANAKQTTNETLLDFNVRIVYVEFAQCKNGTFATVVYADSSGEIMSTYWPIALTNTIRSALVVGTFVTMRGPSRRLKPIAQHKLRYNKGSSLYRLDGFTILPTNSAQRSIDLRLNVVKLAALDDTFEGGQFDLLVTVTEITDVAYKNGKSGLKVHIADESSATTVLMPTAFRQFVFSDDHQILVLKNNTLKKNGEYNNINTGFALSSAIANQAHSAQIDAFKIAISGGDIATNRASTQFVESQYTSHPLKKLLQKTETVQFEELADKYKKSKLKLRWRQVMNAGEPTYLVKSGSEKKATASELLDTELEFESRFCLQVRFKGTVKSKRPIVLTLFNEQAKEAFEGIDADEFTALHPQQQQARIDSVRDKTFTVFVEICKYKQQMQFKVRKIVL